MDLKNVELPFFTVDRERTFETRKEDDALLKLKIVAPTSEQILEADLQYRKVYSKALRLGIIVQAEAERFVKERKLLDADLEAEIKKCQEEIAGLEIKLANKEMSREDGFVAANKLTGVRDELMRFNKKVTAIFDTTCENLSDEYRMQYLTVMITRNEDGSAFFKDYEDFSKRTDERATVDAVRHTILTMARLKDNFLMDLPENKWLKDNGFVDEKGLPIMRKSEPKIQDTGPQEEHVSPIEVSKVLGVEVENSVKTDG